MADKTPAPLYQHAPRPHAPKNANAVHQTEAPVTGMAAVNQQVAVLLTAKVGSMWTAYVFTALALFGLLGVLAILSPSVYTLIAWLSQTLIQLVLLPVIMVGQNVLNRKSELQADEQFHAVLNTQHDAEQVMRHLAAQDAELLKQTALLTQLATAHADRDDAIAAHLARIHTRLDAAPAPATPRTARAAKSG